MQCDIFSFKDNDFAFVRIYVEKMQEGMCRQRKSESE